MNKDSRDRKRYWVLGICGFLLLAVAGVFGQTVHHEFINYDDNEYVYENPHITGGLTLDGICWAFAHSHADNWHPLTTISHMLDCELYGLQAGGHHLTNVILHAAVTLLLFLVLIQMTGDLWPSAAVAALFAVHPLHVESVAWVSERKDVLSALFFVLALGMYTRYVRSQYSLSSYLSVILLFALGLMAKPMLVTFPFVLLLLDYWPFRRFGSFEASRPIAASNDSSRRRMIRGCPILEKIPLLVLAAISCAVTLVVQSQPLRVGENFPFPMRIGNALISYVAYLGKFFFPAELAVIYPHRGGRIAVWEIVSALLVLMGISILAWVWRRRQPQLLVGWLWYLGMLVPVIGLVQVGTQAMADRYSYLTQIGLYLALAWSVAGVVRSRPQWRWLCASISALAIAVLIVCSWRQASLWRNSETLWRHTISCTSRNAVALNNYAVALDHSGRRDEAAAYFQEALAIAPQDSEAHCNLGITLQGMGRFREAIAHYRLAISLDRRYAAAQNDLAWLLATAPDPALRNGREAAVVAQQALDLSGSADPNFLDTMAAAYAEMGRFSDALDAAQRALGLARDNVLLAEAIRGRIKLYRGGTPYRESAGKETTVTHGS